MSQGAALYELHEDRLHELEQRLPDLQVEFAEHSTNFTHLKASIDDQVLPSMKRIEEAIAKMAADGSEAARHIEQRLGVLEGDRNVKIEGRKLWRGRLLGGAGLLIGAMLAKFGEAIFAWLST